MKVIYKPCKWDRFYEMWNDSGWKDRMPSVFNGKPFDVYGKTLDGTKIMESGFLVNGSELIDVTNKSPEEIQKIVDCYGKVG